VIDPINVIDGITLAEGLHATVRVAATWTLARQKAMAGQIQQTTLMASRFDAPPAQYCFRHSKPGHF
jgi:hypothetical protein